MTALPSAMLVLVVLAAACSGTDTADQSDDVTTTGIAVTSEPLATTGASETTPPSSSTPPGSAAPGSTSTTTSSTAAPQTSTTAPAGGTATTAPATTAPTGGTTTAPAVVPPTTTSPAGTARPTVTITSPAALSKHFAELDPATGELAIAISLSADVSDPDGGPLRVEWFSSIDGALGEGASIDVIFKPQADTSAPLITAVVIDETGAVAVDSIEIFLLISSG